MNQDKLYVGIDVSSKNNVCYLMQSDGSKHSSFSVPNNRNGAKLIVDRVTSVLLSQDIPQVVIGMEVFLQSDVLLWRAFLKPDDGSCPCKLLC